MEYVELNVVSNFSFLRGASHPGELVQQCAELKMGSIGLTDRNTLAGMVRAHVAAKQSGVRLIVGCCVTPDDAPPLLVWPTDRAAYGRLCRLLTLGKRRVGKGEFRLSMDEFLQHSDGLFVAVAPESVETGDDLSGCRSVLETLKDALGGRLSLAGGAMYGADNAGHLAHIAELSRQTGVAMLATNHVHYHDPSRRFLQDILTCIRHGCTIDQAGYRLFPNAERYLKSARRMGRLFVDYPRALARSMEIAEACAFNMESLRYEYPDELCPPGRSALQYLTELTRQGAAEHYPGGIPDKVRQQLEHELRLIEKLNFSAYFLTVHDLVRFARSRGILCQGRGSAANSAVCYCLGVTNVDPTRIDLLFERFISSARGEPPDIDIDFEHERREEVIQYIYHKYGRDRAGMTAEVISYRGRSAVRDVGKAMGLSMDSIDSMARQLDWGHRGVLSDKQVRAIGLNPDDPTIRRTLALSGQLIGFPRHLGQHVGGMVMTRGPLCELTPIENAAMDGRTIIEWDKDDIDAMGILKVDCLGLGMLSCISKAFKLINSGINDSGERLCLHSLPQDDPSVYEMISNADTVGVFQIESRAQMSMLPRLRPRCFYDLVIEVAIVRPGPIQGNMIHPYLRRRNGEEPVTYPSEALRGVLAKTLGIMLFQEQVMRVAMVAAGFSAEEADQLRRAMAAWRKDGMLEPFRDRVVCGMISNGYSPEFAEQCWSQIRGFGEYGFPESHSASFAHLVYVSAWLKRYHPAVFAASLINSQPMGFYAPAQIIRDAKAHGVCVYPIDVNRSHWDCTLEPPALSAASSHPGVSQAHAACSQPASWGQAGPCLRLGLRLIKGFSKDFADAIVEARDARGSFASVEQLQHRAGLPHAAMQRLAEADALCSIHPKRRQALWQALELDNHPAPLFDLSSDGWSPHEGVAPRNDSADKALPAMPLEQEVLTDYVTTGLSLKQHPVGLVRNKLTAMRIVAAADLTNHQAGRWVKVAGLVLVRQRPQTASGVVFMTLEDETGIVNLIIRPDIFERYRPAARYAKLLHAEGYLERQGQVQNLMVKRIFSLDALLPDGPFTSRNFH